jgi:hypothetical protein
MHEKTMTTNPHKSLTNCKSHSAVSNVGISIIFVIIKMEGTSLKQPLAEAEGPCGCIVEVGSEETGEMSTSTHGRCTCSCCGANCRCIQSKGRCNCAERMKSAAEAHRPTTGKVVAPPGCVVEIGAEDVCSTCGLKGCRCDHTKGRCECSVQE